MIIERKEITVRDLVVGYQDNNENGVVGCGGKLDIRPPFQREFIYKDKQRDAVINSITKDFLSGAVNRQEYLEKAIEWISQDGDIEKYMSENQHEPNANELWLYFQSVINWVKTIFPKYRREMKGIEWGFLYNEFKNQKFDTNKLEDEISKLMEDEGVGSKKGIYSYVLTRKEKHLNIRAFSPNQKREAYERQTGICVVCKEHFEIEGMEADHITPWHEGGKTIAENCQMLCKDCNRRKSGK